METLNGKTVTVKIKRIELLDLMLACSAVSTTMQDMGKSAKKWDALHDKLEEILEDFDRKQGATT